MLFKQQHNQPDLCHFEWLHLIDLNQIAKLVIFISSLITLDTCSFIQSPGEKQREYFVSTHPPLSWAKSWYGSFARSIVSPRLIKVSLMGTFYSFFTYPSPLIIIANKSCSYWSTGLSSHLGIHACISRSVQIRNDNLICRSKIWQAPDLIQWVRVRTKNLTQWSRTGLKFRGLF